MSQKSRSCRSKKTGKPLSEYLSEYEAQEGADYVKYAYKTDVIPYQCTQCKRWHLSPVKDIQNTICDYCVDQYGSLKDLYPTKQDAQKKIELLYQEQNIRLSFYKCPYYDGWHLTKRSSKSKRK